MKRKLFIILLILPLLLVGCKKNKTTKLPVDNTNNKTTEITTNKEGEDTQNPEGTTDGENVENPDETDPANTEVGDETNPEATAKAFDKDFLRSLCDDSSYISRIRVNQDSTEGYTASFVVDYKGDLSQVEMTIPKTLRIHRLL